MTETLDSVQSSDFNEKGAMEDGQASSQSNEDSQEIPSIDTDMVVGNEKQTDSESTDISREEENSRSDSGVCSPSTTDVKKQGNGSEIEKVIIKPEDVLDTPKTPETDCSENWEKETVPTSEDSPQRPVISVRKSEDLFGMVNGSNEQCSVCNEKFSSPSALEQHRATAGHYFCTLQECSGLTFQSAVELGEHQAVHHQPPVQQLAQQVQRIPATFNSQSSYRPSTTPPLQRYGSIPQTIGSGVVLSPVNPSASVPNLPPGIQLSKRPAPQPPESSPMVKQRREETNQPTHIRLPDSITLVSRTSTQPSAQQRQRESVTDMLANRGITVVPSGRAQSAASSQPVLPRQLNSAISITPSSQHRAGFVTPAPKAPVNKLPTVDLTKESDSPRRSLNRGGRVRGPTGRSVCQICDKAFPTPTELSQHMVCHRGGAMANKLAYECRECTAQYPTEAGLQAHRQKYHGAGGPSPDMAIPVVDLKQVGVLSRLAALGIRAVIPLAQLHSGSGGGMFGLPVVAVDSASNPAICNIGGMGASNLLPLGPLKNLTFNNNMR